MMMKGPFRELIPIGRQDVGVRLPDGAGAQGVQLLVSGIRPEFTVKDGTLSVAVPSVLDHEVVAIDLGASGGDEIG
jgi:hypothetical protein